MTTDTSPTLIEQFERFYTDLTHASLAELDALYAPDIVFVDPVTQHKGLPALRTYFENLLENCSTCTFDIFERISLPEQATITWQLNYQHPKLKGGQRIEVAGISVIKIQGQKISFQQDYYDLGAMLYEHVPVLGGLIRSLRKRLAA